MDMNRLINMLVKMFMRKAMNHGVKIATDQIARRGKPAAELTPEEREQAARAGALTKRARQMTRLGRRIGK